MRLHLPLLLASTLLCGCFVLDELDAGNAILDEHRGTKPVAESEAKPGAEGEKPGPPTGTQWWSKARSLNRSAQPATDAGDPDALVRCRIAGSQRFMRRVDCASQGGSAEG